MDYGADEDYAALGEASLAGWRRWNARWPRPLFHETGVMFVSRVPMAGFERDSYDVLTRRGHALQRLDADALAVFADWNRSVFLFADGPAHGVSTLSAVTFGLRIR